MTRGKSLKQDGKLNQRRLSGLIFTFLVLPFALCLAQPTFSQDDGITFPKDVVPPPLNVIAEDDLDRLKLEKKTRKRVKLALKLMDERLTQSEEFIEKNEYDSALKILGFHQGILIYTISHLKTKQGRRGSAKNFKRLEMSLRDVIPQLELIRRELPYKYGFHVLGMIDYVRDTRTRALDHLFDDSVVPNASN